MIVSDGDDHRRRRSSVQSAFSRRRLNGWIPMILEQTDAAIDRLADGTDPGTVVDMYPVGRALVLRIVVRSLFGERMSQRCDEIGDLFQRPQDYLESPAIRRLPHPFPRTERARVRADRDALDEIIDRRSRIGGRTRPAIRSTSSKHSWPTERSTMPRSTIGGDADRGGLRRDVGLPCVDAHPGDARAGAVGSSPRRGRSSARPAGRQGRDARRKHPR